MQKIIDFFKKLFNTNTSSKSTTKEEPISITFSYSETSEPKSILIIPDISHKIRCHTYKVKGKNPKTGRLKTCTILAKENPSIEEVCFKSGFEEPITLELDMESYTEREPSENQIKYANDLNIPIPPQCSCADLSCLISKQLGEDSNDLISNGLTEYACEKGLYLSPYCGALLGIPKIVYRLRNEEVISFFIYLVYCSISNSEPENPNNSPYKQIFQDFSIAYINDEGILNTVYSFFEEEYFEQLLIKKRVDGRSKKKANLCNLAKDYLIEKIPSLVK